MLLWPSAGESSLDIAALGEARWGRPRSRRHSVAERTTPRRTRALPRKQPPSPQEMLYSRMVADPITFRALHETPENEAARRMISQQLQRSRARSAPRSRPPPTVKVELTRPPRPKGIVHRSPEPRPDWEDVAMSGYRRRECLLAARIEMPPRFESDRPLWASPKQARFKTTVHTVGRLGLCVPVVRATLIPGTGTTAHRSC
eukprot:TRINITY_DN3512_c0_g1_i1.p1 TRINITY_DN3512_c0_g1~~TRINITY_DN3512_c0_g1_i1.p1  ORF type:complete len:202 (+),score=4.34 TRINITY_DN3512_c0_g1_i1:273-878(+)